MIFGSYFLFLVIAMTISLIDILQSSYMTGELASFPCKLSDIDVIFLYVINVFLLLLTMAGCRYISRFRLVSGYNLRIEQGKLNYLMFFFIIINIFFVITTKVGVVGSNATSPYTPIVFFFRPDSFFYIYYIINRKCISSFRLIFFINLIAFSILKLSQGWSGFILFIFLLELFYRFGNQSFFKRMHYALIFPFIILIFGGALYSQVYVIKNEIRGTPVEPVSISNGIAHFANRLSYIPITVGAVQNKDVIVNLYKSDGRELKEFKSIFRPLLPSFIFEDKMFRTLNNVVMQSYYPDISIGTSSNFGLPLYIYILSSISKLDALIYFFCFCFFVFFVKFIFDFISGTDSYLRAGLSFLFFLMMIDLYTVASLEAVFSYGFFSNITFLILGLIMRAFKLSKDFNLQ